MGAQKLDELLLWCSELEIPAVTLWVCSTENLKRSPVEVPGILGAVEAREALGDDPSVTSGASGSKPRVGSVFVQSSTVAVIRRAEEATAGYDAMTLTIAVAYGGRGGDRRCRSRPDPRQGAGRSGA